MSKNEALKKFEEIGYEIEININSFVRLKSKQNFKLITVFLDSKQYMCSHYLDASTALLITYQENKLLNELFKEEA